MKEIREIKMVEQTTVTYVANDGTKFDNEDECVVYEKKKKKEECADNYKRVCVGVIPAPFLDFCGGQMVAHIVHMKNYNEYLDVKAWANLQCYEGVELAPPTSFPATKIICMEDYWADWVYDDDEYIPKIINNFKMSVKMLEDAFPGWNDDEQIPLF